MLCSKFIKAFTVVLLCTGLIILAACNSRSRPYNGANGTSPYDEGIAGTTLIIYSTFTYDFASPIIQLFQERYGANVELHLAGTTQTLARIRAEEEHPQSDLMWGGDVLQLASNIHLFEDFVSASEPYMLPGTKNNEGAITRFAINAGVLMVNTNLIGGIEINGYACLLNPELSGYIAITYPVISALPFNHLFNQLYAMGGGNPNNGWDYMEQFIINVGGIILQSPAAVHTGVANGEFIVGLTYEKAALAHIAEGAPVRLVHISEGTLPGTQGAAIIRGAENREAAEVFIDFITSYEIQTLIAETYKKRPVRGDIPPTGALTANAELNWITACTIYILEHQESWVESFWDLWMAHN